MPGKRGKRLSLNTPELQQSFVDVTSQGKDFVSRLRSNLWDWEIGKHPDSPKATETAEESKELVTQNDSEVVKKSTVVKYTATDMQLAERLLGLVEQNFPTIKKPKLEEWAEEIEKLHRIDGQDYKLINAVVDWSQANGFWKRNIRSGGSLRKHFEKLCMQAHLEFDEKKGKVYSV